MPGGPGADSPPLRAGGGGFWSLGSARARRAGCPEAQRAAAIEVAARHLAAGGRYLGTTMILAELHGHLLHLRGPSEARIAIDRLLIDPAHDWVAVDHELVATAIASWLHKFADQRFTLTDAVSFEVMRRQRVTQAFAFDHHFEVAGYELMAAS